jgi:peptide/nickel transport system permease protein
MIPQRLKNPFFLVGFGMIFLFAVLGFLGYGITVDTTPNCNQIMPEWAGLSPGSKVYYVQEKRTQPREWNFWLFGDGNQGEIVSVVNPEATGNLNASKNRVVSEKSNASENSIASGNSISNDTAYFISQKNGERLAIPLKQWENNAQVYERTFWLGSDPFGRDMLSRLIIGTRVSLTIGFLAMALSLIIGVVVGLVAGYFGGWVDTILTWFITVFWSVPTLLIALGMSFFMGKGFYQVLLATGLSTWVEVARVVRGQTMQYKNKEFILSARITGFSSWHIMFKHILPNLSGSLTVLATTNFAAAILLEAGLGFLGLGVAPPTASWGMMVKENIGYLVLDQAYLAILPGIAIMILVMAFNLLAMGLRDEDANQ